MVTYIPTKTVAKLIRAELAAHFPGVKFSVRCGTGTGSAWIRVSCDDAGTLVQGNLVGPDDEVAVIGGRVQRAPWMDAHQAVQLALNERDLTPSRTH